MNREQVLRKIRACLRLAESSNPNEAATALRQARKMMDEHAVSMRDVHQNQCHRADAPTRSRGAIAPTSVTNLACVVADGFRCQVLLVTQRRATGGAATVIRFYGLNADAQVAAYAFTVLRRQLEAARKAYAKQLRARKPSVRKARLEQFALGWVMAVGEKFPRADVDEATTALIGTSMLQDGHEDREPTTGRNDVGKKGQLEDAMYGYRAGSQVQLHAGLVAQPASLEHLP